MGLTLGLKSEVGAFVPETCSLWNENRVASLDLWENKPSVSFLRSLWTLLFVLFNEKCLFL